MFFWFLDEKPKIARVLAWFSDRETAKTNKTHVFFWFLSEKPKIARVLARFSDRETAKTKTTYAFFWFFDPKTKKHSVKPKKPKIRPKPKDSLPDFGFLVFWFRAASLKPRVSVLSPKPCTWIQDQTDSVGQAKVHRECIAIIWYTTSASRETFSSARGSLQNPADL